MSTETCTTESCGIQSEHDTASRDKTKLKATIVVLSDPKSGSQEEALGRVFNALAAAYDFKQRGDDVSVQFQGPGLAGLASSAKKTTRLTPSTRKSKTRSRVCHVAVPTCSAAVKKLKHRASI